MFLYEESAACSYKVKFTVKIRVIIDLAAFAVANVSSSSQISLSFFKHLLHTSHENFFDIRYNVIEYYDTVRHNFLSIS